MTASMQPRATLSAGISGTFSRRTFLTRSAAVAGAGTVAIAASGFAPVARHAGAQDFEAAAVYEPSDSVMVNTDLLNLRSDPGLSGSVIGAYPYGTVAVVLDGPSVADNYRWYLVQIGSGSGVTIGWFAGVYLSPADTPVQPAFTVIDGPVNLRDDSGLSSNIIGVYPTGATGIAFDHTPNPVDGYVWYEVRMDNDNQYGYVAADFIGF
ncbi:MAG: SH3 domain-containing protein [Thermomicrobiales bacterium]